MDGANALLASVSRSFYLSMQFLPARMKPGVACAYMLARATDTVADASSLSVEKRINMLGGMRLLIANDKVEDKDCCLDSLKSDFAPNLTHQGEKQLLSRFGECLELMHRLPDDQIVLVRKVLGTIIDGQAWDLEYFQTQARVLTDQALDLYTYRVAGCVGEFWTDMGFLCYGDTFAIRNRSEMREMGILYGQGLQLVNILRDRGEDEQNGRFYLPDVEGRDAIGYWMQKAQFNLHQGVRYAGALRGIKLRFTTILPAWLGIKTLALVSMAAPQEGQPKPKITRKEVRKTMFKALAFAFGRACLDS